MPKPTPPKKATAKQVAEYLGAPLSTVEHWPKARLDLIKIGLKAKMDHEAALRKWHEEKSKP